MTMPGMKVAPFVIIALGLALPIRADAQRGLQEMGPSNPRTGQVAYEAISTFGDDTARAHVDINYRINRSFFVFIRNTKTVTDDFSATGEILVELQNDKHEAIGRETRPVAFQRSSLPKEDEATIDLQGSIPFDIPEGSYRIVFEVNDHGSGRQFSDRSRTFQTKRPKLTPLESSSPIFVEQPSADSTGRIAAFTALNRGVDLPFGAAGGYLFQVCLPENPDSFKTAWSIDAGKDDHSDPRQIFHGSEAKVFKGRLKVAQDPDAIRYSVTPSPFPWYVVYLPLPFAKLETGEATFVVDLKNGRASQRVTHRFRIFWANRPFSLSNFTLAVDALQYIATDAEIERMRGVFSNGVEDFRAFWKVRDPDTTTAYNEVMAEYYRRVDEAIRRFSPLGGSDGYRTDRGRILILFGSPDKSEHFLLPNSTPTEIWTYERTRRRFVFTDESRNGVYYLTQSDSL